MRLAVLMTGKHSCQLDHNLPSEMKQKTKKLMAMKRCDDISSDDSSFSDKWATDYKVSLRLPICTLKLSRSECYKPGANTSRGMFHKTLQICKLQICSYSQILTVNLVVNFQNSIIYGHFAINYKGKSFMEQAPDKSSPLIAIKI